MKKYFIFFLLIAFPLFAQELKEETNSLFDESDVKEFPVTSILVEGEVEQPGPVYFASLPVRNVPVKELSLKNGKDKFIGSYYYSGYSLYDILSLKKVRKAGQSDFRPAVDLFVIVENGKGEKAVFSWGEIFYTKDNFRILISKSVNAVNPSKMKMKWPLPREPRVICAGDAYNFRFISNPVKITVKSFPGVFPAVKTKEIYSPVITITSGERNGTIEDIDSGIQKRIYRDIGYGHGMGFKGVRNIEGYLFKDVLATALKLDNSEIANSVVCFSAKDGYRAVLSLNEIMNRSDNVDFILAEQKDSKEDGRYILFAAPDFFVDRNVRAVEKIQILKIK